MNTKHLMFCLLSVGTHGALAQVHEAEAGFSRFLKLNEPPPHHLNQVSLGYWGAFNISADFTGAGSFSAGQPPFSGSGIHRQYEDGFVGVDSSGNAGGVTTFWGYENASQAGPNAARGGFYDLQLSSLASNPLGGIRDIDNDPHHGFQVVYSRELGTWKNTRWGVEGSFGYTALELATTVSLVSDVTLTTDTYETFLFAGAFPTPPYQGPYIVPPGGGNPTIPESPTSRATSTFPGSTVEGMREFEADIYSIHLGPYLEIPVHQRLEFYLSGGLALVGVKSSFGWEESTVLGANAFSASDSSSHSSFKAGIYAAGNIQLKVNSSLTLFSGVQYQNINSTTHRSGSKTARLDLGKTIFVTTGFGYSF